MERGAVDLHEKLWPGRPPVVGVIHLLPLPGSPRWGGSMAEVTERSRAEAELLIEGGMDGLLVENFMDAPFHPGPVPPETVAALTAVVLPVVAASSVPVGINVLRNDAGAGLAVAAATGASFIRVNVHTGSMFTDQGLLHGKAHETLRKRRFLGIEVAILADVLVKHATPPPGTALEAAARDAWSRGLADGLILTGDETGSPVHPGQLRRVRDAIPDHGRIWIGSGVTPKTVRSLLGEADGVIVGSALQAGGRAGGGVERARVEAFIEALRR
ncbi:MAG: BtpA/SgcQ family protein [Longimicrobiales bacterium]